MLSPRFTAAVVVTALAVVAGPLGALANQMPPYRAAQRIQIHFEPGVVRALQVDLRPQIDRLGLNVRDQGDRGTCSVFATTFLIEYATGQNGLDLSEEYLNWAKNQANHTDTDGGYFTDIIRGYQQFGMVPQPDMPNLPKFHPNHPDTPSQAVVTAGTGAGVHRYPLSFIKQWDNQHGMSATELNAAKAALQAGHPVATGIWWLENFETVTVDNVPLIKEYPRLANTHSDASLNPMFDGHSIDLVGYQEGSQFPGGGYFVFRNSFGTGFGHNGYGFVSFQYLRDYSNDAIVVTDLGPRLPIPATPRQGPGKANPHF
jgi:hypothetical protein